VTPVLEISGVQKGYQTLRPLRLAELTIVAGERVAITGLDAGAAEVLVNLVTGRSLPDQGVIRVLGRPTAEISGADDWLASLDRFGIVSDRGILLEGSTVEQNLAMPFTLQIDPVQQDTRDRVAALARDVGIHHVPEPAGTKSWLQWVTGEVPPEIRARMHVARAIALEPALLLFEHPTAQLAEGTRAAFAEDVASVADARQLAALVITQDDAFAKIAAHRVYRLEPATGGLKPVRRGWFR
jgi:ABC-type lipoprotein export system ATPase subunit